MFIAIEFHSHADDSIIDSQLLYVCRAEYLEIVRECSAFKHRKFSKEVVVIDDEGN